MKDFESKINCATKKSNLSRKDILYSLLMLCASKIHELGQKGFKADSDKFEILVTIKVKDDENAQ